MVRCSFLLCINRVLALKNVKNLLYLRVLTQVQTTGQRSKETVSLTRCNGPPLKW